MSELERCSGTNPFELLGGCASNTTSASSKKRNKKKKSPDDVVSSTRTADSLQRILPGGVVSSVDDEDPDDIRVHISSVSRYHFIQASAPMARKSTAGGGGNVRVGFAVTCEGIGNGIISLTSEDEEFLNHRKVSFDLSKNRVVLIESRTVSREEKKAARKEARAQWRAKHGGGGNIARKHKR